MTKRIFTFLLNTFAFLSPIWAFSQAGNPNFYFNTYDNGVFGDGTGVSSSVYCSATQPDGKIIIAGRFTRYNGATVNRIARLNPDGSLDNTFNSGTGVNSTVYAIGLQSDGKIIISGDFTTYNGTRVKHIARLNTTGSLDQSFHSGFGVNRVGSTCCASINAMVIQPDNKIIIAGYFDSLHNTLRNSVARLNANGTLDGTFSGAASSVNSMGGTIHSVALQSDGKVVLGGTFYYYYSGSNTRRNIGRLNTNGSVDNTFAPSGVGLNGANDDGDIRSVILQGDGKVLIGGNFTHIGSTTKTRVARLNANGSLDGGFTGPSISSSVRRLKYLSSGKILLGNADIRRLNSDGTADLSFLSKSSNGLVWDFNVQGNGDVLVMGDFTAINGVARSYIMKLNANADTIKEFNKSTGANGRIASIQGLSDGNMIIGGYFKKYNNTDIYGIARIDPDGILDTSFKTGSGVGSNSSYFINTISVQSDKKIIAAGDFPSFNGFTTGKIVRLKQDGTTDSSFTTGSGANSAIQTSIIQPDGKIIIAGSFTEYNGAARSRIARINADGTLDNSFVPGTINSTVSSLLLQQDGKIIIAGYFTNVGGAGRNYITRLLANGTLDQNFNPGAGTGTDRYITSVVQLRDGSIAIGGDFSTFNGTASKGLAILNADGSLKIPYPSGNSGLNGSVDMMGLDILGRLLLSGGFTTIHGVPQAGFARLLPDGTPDRSFDAGTGAEGSISDFHNMDNGNLVIAGSFKGYNGMKKNNLAGVMGDVLSFSISIDTAAICSNEQFKAAIITRDFPEQDNVYSLELSDVSGSFSSPVVIASKASTRVKDSLNIVLPANIQSGKNYRVRLTRSNPALTSADNGFNITINTAYLDTLQITACDKYTSGGDVYTTSGVYYDTMQTVRGCDSIIVLELTINHSDTTTFTQTACDSFTWVNNGVIYYSSGTYYDTLSNVNGCDSLLRLDLTIQEGVIITTQLLPTATLCEGDNINLSIAATNAAAYQWYKGSTLLADGGNISGATSSALEVSNATPSDNGSYSVVISPASGVCAAVGSDTTKVTVNASNSVLAEGGSNVTIDQGDGNTNTYSSGSCGPIATITDATGGNTLGIVTVQVSVDPEVQTTPAGEPYVQRHYTITPENNGAATLTLFTTQAEFDAYNTAAGSSFPKMPAYPTDPNIANIRISKYEGVSFAPPAMLITPSSVVWNGEKSWWEITLMVPGFSSFYIHTSLSGVPLEVKFGGITATNEGAINRIVWNSLSEKNADRYEVEKSEDGVAFEYFGVVKAKGLGANYSYLDETAAIGTSYYRVKYFDLYGRFAYSQVVKATVQTKASFEVVAYPNPLQSGDDLTIEIPLETANDAKFIIADQFGKIIQTVAATGTKTVVRMSHLAPGVYFVKCANEKCNSVIKVSKK